MFKQVKSALFWYYLYKFRRRVMIIVLLLLIAVFANAIYTDVVQYLTLKKKLEFLEFVVIAKWLIIIFNISFSIYLILTIFKTEDKEKQKQKELMKKSTKKINKDNNSAISKSSQQTTPIFTSKEQKFLKKRKLRTKADILLEN